MCPGWEASAAILSALLWVKLYEEKDPFCKVNGMLEPTPLPDGGSSVPDNEEGVHHYYLWHAKLLQ